jgi:hypothetical protein
MYLNVISLVAYKLDGLDKIPSEEYLIETVDTYISSECVNF